MLFLVVLATLMIPDQLRLVPVYLLFNTFGLTEGVGQYGGVILVLAISATSIFLLRQYFLSIPHEIEEAARIDGAGYLHDLPAGDAAAGGAGRWPRSPSSSSRARGTATSGRT